MEGAPRQGLAARAHPTAPARNWAAKGTGAAPAIRCLPGDGDRLRLGRDVDSCMGLASGGHGQAGKGCEKPSCGMAGGRGWGHWGGVG